MGLLRDCAFGGRDADSLAAEADCAVGFAFGLRRTPRGAVPGESNEVLARLLATQFADGPQLLQWELADLVGRAAPAVEICPLGGDVTGYLDTRRVACEAAAAMRGRGLTSAAVFAHPLHAPRARAALSRLGVRALVAPGLDVVPFCRDSAQWWTRSRAAWVTREVPTVLYYGWRGWV